MNNQQKLTTIAFWIALVGFSYWAIAQSNAKTWTEYFELEQKNIQLENEIWELKQQRWDYEDMKKECIDSYTEQQEKVSKQADRKRIEQWNNTVKQMGLLKRSQPQKKINQQESKSITSDTAEKTEDNRWFNRLLRWVDSIW